MMTSRAGTPRTEGGTTTDPSSLAGFTLIELMLVLLLLGTFASLVAPRFHLSQGTLLFQESSRVLMTDLERVRLEAIQSGTQREVVLTRPSEGIYEVHRFSPRQADPWEFARTAHGILPQVQEIKPRDLPGEVRLASNVHRILFLPDGSATPCWIEVQSRDGRRQSLIVVDRVTGVVSRLGSTGIVP